MSDQRTTTVTTETISVDSGTVWVGDPCYLIDKLTRASWSEAVDARHSGPAGEHVDNPQITPLHGGLWLGTLYGDGTYQVTFERNAAGDVVRFTVDFDDRPTEDELNDDPGDLDDHWGDRYTDSEPETGEEDSRDR